jgi:hypothetical protein
MPIDFAKTFGRVIAVNIPLKSEMISIQGRREKGKFPDVLEKSLESQIVWPVWLQLYFTAISIIGTIIILLNSKSINYK